MHAGAKTREERRHARRSIAGHGVLTSQEHLAVLTDSYYDNGGANPVPPPWAAFTRETGPHDIELVRRAVKPEHWDCFLAHVAHFEAWVLKTCGQTGWPMLRFPGGRMCYMHQVNKANPVSLTLLRSGDLVPQAEGLPAAQQSSIKGAR